MADKHAEFVGSIPEIYDEHLGPLLFEFYAADLAGRLAVPASGRVLETACGTGIATRVLRDAMPDEVEIVATDLNTAMLDLARANVGGPANLHFREADALDLPFDGGAFDAVVCQFGVMFFPDKAAGMREAARVLKPGGLFLFSVWDSPDFNPIIRVALETIGRFFETDPPNFHYVPYGYYELDPIKGLLLDAGFHRIDISVLPALIERPSARDVATGLIAGTPTIHEILDRATAPPEEVIEALATALRDAFGDAPLRTPLQAMVIAARLPAD